jgi:hypothetical protein
MSSLIKKKSALFVPIFFLLASTGYGQQVVTWTSMVGVTVYESGLKMTATTGPSGAFSVESIPAGVDGSIEMMIGNSECYVGLSASNLDNTFNSINYALELDGTSGTVIYENGTKKKIYDKKFESKSRFKIQRVGTTISYILDDVKIYTSLAPSSTALFVDVTIETKGYVSPKVTMTYAGLFEAPTNLLAQATDVATASLTWRDNTTAESNYEIERSLSETSGFSVIATVPANTTAYTDNTLTAGTSYYYRVRAKKSDGTASSYSNTATLTPYQIPSPTALAAGTLSKTAVSLYWVDNSTVEEAFELERSTVQTSGFAVIASVPANTTTYTDNSLAEGVTYFYRVRAKKGVGVSAYSNTVSSTTYQEGVWLQSGNNLFALDKNVGIGTSRPTEKLTVKGNIHAEEVKVDLTVPGPDYVFEKSYSLLSLQELKAYIEQYKHLPEIPSAREMEAAGIDLSKLNILLLKKIEELTLYTLEQELRLKALEKSQQGK